MLTIRSESVNATAFIKLAGCQRIAYHIALNWQNALAQAASK